MIYMWQVNYLQLHYLIHMELIIYRICSNCLYSSSLNMTLLRIKKRKKTSMILDRLMYLYYTKQTQIFSYGTDIKC